MRFVSILIMLVCFAYPRPLHAGPPPKPTNPEALAHFNRGNKLFNVRSFDEAVTAYKAGALVEAAPIFDYNLGQCYRQLGQYKEAIWHYERFLKRGQPEQDYLDGVTGLIAQMRSELDKAAMTQQPTEPAPEPVPASTTPSSDAAWYSDAMGWGLTAAGAVGLGVAGGLFLSASNLDDDANQNPIQRERDDLYDQASRRRLVGTIVGIGGAGLLVTGVIKLAITPTGARSATSWNLGVSGNGVMVFGRF
jgi:tetratricopeptide (TPR) repeat protein